MKPNLKPGADGVVGELNTDVCDSFVDVNTGDTAETMRKLGLSGECSDCKFQEECDEIN